MADLRSAMLTNNLTSAINIALAADVGSGLARYIALLCELEADPGLAEALEASHPGMVVALLIERNAASLDLAHYRLIEETLLAADLERFLAIEGLRP